mmetsp:Transcript_12202/g.26696  ORF Transcript_12202/g.26696 Transcript_12202/m.26696 type:complete len:117 (-) Transcript_12202:311-661(-)
MVTETLMKEKSSQSTADEAKPRVEVVREQSSGLQKKFEDDPFGVELNRKSIFARLPSGSTDSAYEADFKSLRQCSKQASIRSSRSRPLKVEHGTVQSTRTIQLSTSGAISETSLPD